LPVVGTFGEMKAFPLQKFLYSPRNFRF
jgi:hypothetical protein